MSIEFAVKVKGIHDPDADECAWVLAVDGDRLLIVHRDKTLHWHPLEDCIFAMAKMPATKQPAGPGLVAPNRAVRRAVEHNGA